MRAILLVLMLLTLAQSASEAAQQQPKQQKQQPAVTKQVPNVKPLNDFKKRLPRRGAPCQTKGGSARG